MSEEKQSKKESWKDTCSRSDRWPTYTPVREEKKCTRSATMAQFAENGIAHFYEAPSSVVLGLFAVFLSSALHVYLSSPSSLVTLPFE